MDEQGASRLRRALVTLTFFTLAAADFWRNLLSWWGFGAVAALIVAGMIVVLARSGGIRWRRLPPSLLAFLGLATLSIAWSFYPASSALGVALTLITTLAGVFLATALSWHDLVTAIAVALRWILGLSLLFELFVATVVRGPLLPLGVDWSQLETIPRAFYWSRGLLFDGGRIQGIVGNANLLAMLALVALLVSLACLAARRGSRPWNAFWALVAIATLLLTRSTTVTVALLVVAVVVAIAALVARSTGRARIGLQIGAAGVGIAAVVVAVVARGPLLALLGKSPDMTHRLEIWDTVWNLAIERPVAGWGWVSWWVPWTEPFHDLVVINGVTYLQAHNAWLDVFLQLGVLGIVVLAVLVLGTTARSWLVATEPGRLIAPGDRERRLDGLLPLALLTVLLVQSLAESRLLIEWGWALLVVLAIRSTDRSVPLRTAPPRIPLPEHRA